MLITFGKDNGRTTLQKREPDSDLKLKFGSNNICTFEKHFRKADIELVNRDVFPPIIGRKNCGKIEFPVVPLVLKSMTLTVNQLPSHIHEIKESCSKREIPLPTSRYQLNRHSTYLSVYHTNVKYLYYILSLYFKKVSDTFFTVFTKTG